MAWHARSLSLLLSIAIIGFWLPFCPGRIAPHSTRHHLMRAEAQTDAMQQHVNDLHSKFVGMAAQRDEHLDVSNCQVLGHTCSHYWVAWLRSALTDLVCGDCCALRTQTVQQLEAQKEQLCHRILVALDKIDELSKLLASVRFAFLPSLRLFLPPLANPLSPRFWRDRRSARTRS